jgi:tRNA 2-selenouridine synthase
MALEKIHVRQFLELSLVAPVLDVRSPGEFGHASIPDAYSFPLFSDEERKVVGTLYKQQSREAAIKAGLDYFGVKMRRMVEEAESICQAFKPTSPARATAERKTVLVHCWRGGMRSGAIAWLLDLYGFRVYTLAGGYKSFRRWVLETLANPGPIRVLGGYTGSGKTDLLQVLSSRYNEKVIDLEGLAGHKGSAFGAIGLPAQSSQEMFENRLATALFTLRTSNPAGGQDEPVWMEDESQRIGTVNLTQSFWQHFRKQPVFFLDIPFEQRLEYLVSTYGKLNRGDLAAAITRIQKRLGGLETKTALMHLVEGNIKESFRILLTYYDKKYGRSLRERENTEQLIQVVPATRVTAEENARLIHSIQTPMQI